jgi:voltage-gated sodium channel
VLRRLVESNAFVGTIIVVIVANAVTLGLETYDGIEERWGDTLDTLETIFLAIFMVELTLRFASYWPRPLEFFKNGWNVFDFVIIGIAFVPGLSQSSTLFRLARLARIVRVVRLLPDVRVLITGVLRSLPPLASIALLTSVVLFAYGMVGWSLFGDELPDDWGNIGRAMLTLFVMLTLENFPIYMEQGMEVYPWSWVYFVTFILIAAFVVLNVLIGIVLNSMEEAREIERRRARGIPEPELDDPHLAPVLERIAILRSALTELEEELAALRRPR